MKIRLATLFIIGLCLISVIIGLLGIGKKEKATAPCPVQPKAGIFKGVSAGGEKIALITLQGVIAYDPSGGFIKDFTSADTALKALNRAYQDDSVKGVIFRVNSPGGTVAMSQEIYNSILQLREEKPVLVSMADVAASGGYYIASAADRIYANPGTLTGSIGVIMETINAKGLLTDKLGIQSEIIKSGQYKDIGNVYRGLSEGERELLNNLVNNTYEQFIDAIEKGRIKRKDEYDLDKRALTEETLKKYSDGRVFTGEIALSYGFIDKLGGLATVEEDMKALLKDEDLPVINFNKPRGFEDFFMSVSSRFMPSNNLEPYIPLSKKYPRQPLFIWE